MSDYLQALRNKTAAMVEASKTFVIAATGGGNPEKMKSVIAALTEVSPSVPKAWAGMLLTESIRDHARFNQVDDILALCKEEVSFVSVADDGVDGQS